MTKLTTKARKNIPAKKFGLPNERKYPMEDWTHAANAKSRAEGQYNLGKLSKAKRDKIFAKANAVMARAK